MICRVLLFYSLYFCGERGSITYNIFKCLLCRNMFCIIGICICIIKENLFEFILFCQKVCVYLCVNNIMHYAGKFLFR